MENILIKKVYQKVCSYKKIKGGREKKYFKTNILMEHSLIKKLYRKRLFL